MTIGEHHVLALRVNLPKFRDRIIGRAAHAILAVIILVGIERIKMQAASGGAAGITTQHEGRRI